MDDALKHSVRQRAGQRCEYCQVHQRYYPDYTFHVEHVIARQHHGSDDVTNLALACHLCNNKKGPNLSGIDPETGQLTPLFHPRDHHWDEHFRLNDDGTIHGLTDVGRTTVDVLGMNVDLRVQIRQEILRLESEQAEQA